jgi:metal-responsive CopG/Arc/MetJ family transcriptional regulator
MRQTVAISLPEDLTRQLDAFVEREGASRSQVVREALRRYLFVQEFRRLREETLPGFAAQGVFTDEDVFERVS